MKQPNNPPTPHTVTQVETSLPAGRKRRKVNPIEQALLKSYLQTIKTKKNGKST